MSNFVEEKRYITEELFKEIKLSNIFKDLFFCSMVITVFLSLFISLSISLLIWELNFEIFYMSVLFSLCFMSFVLLPISIMTIFNFKKKNYKCLDLKFIFCDKIMTLEEQREYFNIVKKLNISSDEINLFISEQMRSLKMISFGNKLVMLLALDKAIIHLENRQYILLNKNIAKSYIDE